MIEGKEDLKEYLQADKKALGYSEGQLLPLFGKEVWKFQIALRRYEYSLNTKKFRRHFWHFVHHHYSVKLGFTIPPNTFGKGLNIHHSGCIVVNKHARVGDYCNLQQGVNIGHNYGECDVPTIGNDVYIGPGAKIFGRVTIADGCAIGANSVVSKSFNNEGMTIVGCPAREVGLRKPGLS